MKERVNSMINLDEIVLQSGAHESAEAGMCVMEMVSYMEDEPWSDHPACVSPVLGAFLRSWNDGLDEETRQRLKPYAARVIGTANDGKDEARAWMATDWLCRSQLPAWLDLAGLTEHAAAVRALGAIASTDSAQVGQTTLAAAGAAARDAARAAAGAAAWDAARAAAGAAAGAAAWDAARAAAGDAAGAAAWDAARAAAWDAAGAAAGAAAWAAAGDAARDAAGAAAWAAAWDAARAAAGAAAWDALKPTATALQASAFDLLDRMIAP